MSTGARQRRGGRTRAGEPALATGLGAATLALGGAASLAGAALPQAQRGRRPPGAARPDAAPASIPEAGGFLAAAALLALSVLADSGVEHYRGSYRNPGMYTPLVVSAVTALAATGDLARPRRRGAAPVYGVALGVGLAGLGFHVFNLLKRPGRLNWLNLFYAAPLGAPAALSLAGMFGLAGSALRRGWRRGAGRALAALSAFGLAGTVAEAGLLHFRGAFQNPFMWLPVSLPPIGAGLLARAALEPAAPPRRPLSRTWLGLTALIGIGGVGFHIFGVSRAMGGWRNWRQTLVDGPPIPAPPAFSALSLAGLAALALRDREAAEVRP
ncbi:MAG TPA: hypothetical protein VHV27_04240 [Phenylobacterium sp.]|nr:hypothetical protein [Phenylobacterium sp.]